MGKSITIMVPAYNEEDNLKRTVISTERILRKFFKDYELLVFDDCSTDKTGKIANELAKNNPRIKVIHNKRNRGLGYNYRMGAKLATKDYYGWVPGDNEVKRRSIETILHKVGEADIILPYTENTKERAFIRRLISISFTTTINLLFGLNLKYYNGIVVHRTDLLKKVKMSTNSFAFQAEILVQLIKMGCTYREVPQYVKRIHKSKMFRLKNLLGVAGAVTRLFYDINIKRLLYR